jgi:hypothetical protein
MKEIYHCTPTELDKQDEKILNMHFEFLMAERKHDFIESQRAKQKAEQNSHSKKR